MHQGRDGESDGGQDANGPLEHVYGPLEHVYGPLEHVYGPLEHVYGPLEHVYGPLEHVYGPLNKTLEPYRLSTRLMTGHSWYTHNTDGITNLLVIAYKNNF